jgi:hypothetical protein
MGCPLPQLDCSSLNQVGAAEEQLLGLIISLLEDSLLIRKLEYGAVFFYSRHSGKRGRWIKFTSRVTNPHEPCVKVADELIATRNSS